MAKTMKAAAPGALTEILDARNLSQDDVSKAWQFSRNTLRGINKGDPVKLETLQRLATHLRVPVDHFLQTSSNSPEAGDGANATTEDDEDQEAGKADAPDNDADPFKGVLLKPADVDALENELRYSVDTTWKIERPIPREAVEPLEKLEEAVNDLESLYYAPPPNKRGSLQIELDKIKAASRLSEIMDELKNHGLHVLLGSYIRWKREVRNPVYEDSGEVVDYKSALMLILCIAPLSAKTKRATVFEGAKPPKYAAPGGPAVYVNGRELPPEPAARAANDDPPADNANDDDIPF